MFRYFPAKIIDNKNLNNTFTLLSITPLSAIEMPKPGQFYMLQTSDSYDPLLKRPFSIFRQEDNTLQFLYRIRGKGTRSLADLKTGSTINVIGPLGNSYPEPEGDFFAVAGGIGIASIMSLMQRFKHRAYFFYGARNSQELLMLGDADEVSNEMILSTDDGSAGDKGLITEKLENFLSTYLMDKSFPVYACGPAPMQKEVCRIASQAGMKCYVSLEEHMACGLGACLGCVVKTTSGYKRVCKEGTVFNAEEIIWE